MGLGVRGLCVSVFDVFWVLFGLFFSVRVFGLRFPFVCVCVCLCVCVCVCLCARVRGRARGLAHFMYPQEKKSKIVIT